jgi:hypothetical protein
MSLENISDNREKQFHNVLLSMAAMTTSCLTAMQHEPGNQPVNGGTKKHHTAIMFADVINNHLVLCDIVKHMSTMMALRLLGHDAAQIPSKIHFKLPVLLSMQVHLLDAAKRRAMHNSIQEAFKLAMEPLLDWTGRHKLENWEKYKAPINQETVAQRFIDCSEWNVQLMPASATYLLLSSSSSENAFTDPPNSSDPVLNRQDGGDDGSEIGMGMSSSYSVKGVGGDTELRDGGSEMGMGLSSSYSVKGVGGDTESRDDGSDIGMGLSASYFVKGAGGDTELHIPTSIKRKTWGDYNGAKEDFQDVEEEEGSTASETSKKHKSGPGNGKNTQTKKHTQVLYHLCVTASVIQSRLWTLERSIMQ